MTTTRLVLVRHGHSMAQATGTAGGHDSCRGLSELGREQVATLAERLVADGEFAPVHAVWTSILPRAVETGRTLADALGVADVEQTCDLCEMHVGEADGMTWDAVRARWPFPDEPDAGHRFAPGAESWTELRARARAILERLVREHEGETVVVATHGGFIAAAVTDLLGVPPERDVDRAFLHTTNTSLTVVAREPVPWLDDDQLRWRLARYNDAAHLVGELATVAAG